MTTTDHENDRRAKRKAYLKQYKAEYKTRTKEVSVNLTKAEYNRFESRANKEGVKVATLLTSSPA